MLNPAHTPVSYAPAGPAAGASALEVSLSAVESELALLGDALRDNDMPAVDQHASSLHRALAAAVSQFAHAARSGPIPSPLRQRLMRASGIVASQRESLARATAALDRAIEVLMPGQTGQAASVYSSYGLSERTGRSNGSLQA